MLGEVIGEVDDSAVRTERRTGWSGRDIAGYREDSFFAVGGPRLLIERLSAAWSGVPKAAGGWMIASP